MDIYMLGIVPISSVNFVEQDLVVSYNIAYILHVINY